MSQLVNHASGRDDLRPVSVGVSPGCHAYLLERHVSKLHFLHETKKREK
jgi:hypothetical protein